MWTSLPRIQIRPALSLRMPNSDSTSSLRLAPTSPPMPRTSPFRASNETSVNDLDSAVAKVAELGGRTVSEVHAENAVFGRWVECQDDQGVRFGLRQPSV